MSNYPISIAFVSGKGGVGKTALAANLAWVCGHVAKTILVDLDFQNQGCTGLFASFTELERDNAIDSIINIESIDLIRPTEIETNLFFLPAVSPGQHLDIEKTKKMTEESKLLDNLSLLLSHLKIKEGFDIVILDCHGGLDHVSYAAFNFSDYILVITEADSVTFSGTLELLTYYSAKSTQLNVQEDIHEHFSRKPSLKFIVNRLQSKYNSEYLEAIYRRYLLSEHSHLKSLKDNSIFCYIPSEDMFANYFGEFPFFVKIDPKSVFSQKIHYIAYQLLNPHFDIQSSRYALLSQYKSSRLREKIERLNVSFESLLKIDILWYFLWFSTAFIGYIFILIALIIFFSHEPDLTGKQMWQLGAFFYISPLLFVPSFVYFSKTIWSVTGLYGRQYNIERLLNNLLKKRSGVHLKFFFLRVILLRLMTVIIVAISSLYLLLSVFFIIISISMYLTPVGNAI